MFFVIFVYTLVRNTKDTLVVNASDAETLTFLKVYGVLPAATLFLMVYGSLSNFLSKKTLFYVTAIPFLVWYGLFAYVLYPMVLDGKLHPHELCDQLLEALGPIWAPRLRYPIDMFRFWTFSTFYIMSEMWGSVAVSILFWQFANDIIKTAQAKRFYPLFGQLANIAPILAGMTVKTLNWKPEEDAPASVKDALFLKSVQYLTLPILISGCLIIILFTVVQGMHEREQELEALQGLEQGQTAPPKPKKPKMGMGESLKFLIQQKYLGCICVLVIAYGLSINVTEVIWKKQIKAYYPTKHEYQNFMGSYSMAVGITTFFVIFAGSSIVRNLGWLIGALTTPVMMGLLCVPFFGFLIFFDVSESHALLGWCVLIGTVQNVLSKAIKYALFDPTKEMAYIPLDQESKIKGKAAIDVLAARVGKSGGSLLQQGIVVVFGDLMRGVPAVAAIFYLTVTAWTVAASSLGVMYHQRVAEAEKLKDMQEPLIEGEKGNTVKAL